jgi:hypothetical protein
MIRRHLPLAATAAALVAVVAAPAANAVTIKRFSNCTAMHKVYPHGVGRVGAHNKGGSLTGHWYVSTPLYTANNGSDRDKDGIACET